MSKLVRGDAYCVSCGESVEPGANGLCPRCGKQVGKGQISLAAALADLIRRMEYELAEQNERRTKASDAIAVGEAALVHVRRAAEVVAGGLPARSRRWGGLWGKCKFCGTREKAHARGGLCVSCFSKGGGMG